MCFRQIQVSEEGSEKCSLYAAANNAKGLHAFICIYSTYKAYNWWKNVADVWLNSYSFIYISLKRSKSSRTQLNWFPFIFHIYRLVGRGEPFTQWTRKKAFSPNIWKSKQNSFHRMQRRLLNWRLRSIYLPPPPPTIFSFSLNTLTVIIHAMSKVKTSCQFSKQTIYSNYCPQGRQSEVVYGGRSDAMITHLISAVD